MVVLTADILSRIERYVSAEPNSGCFLWTGALTNRYACLRIARRTVKVTRLLMASVLGRELRPDEHVLHNCDVTVCVNPAHLRVGTHADNMTDMWTRRRPKRKGEGVGKAKLTEEQVRAIRASSDPQRRLAALYGVVPSTICHARRGATWSDVK